jgi:hypothetical protein
MYTDDANDVHDRYNYQSFLSNKLREVGLVHPVRASAFPAMLFVW